MGRARNGVLLWLQVDDVNAAEKRARSLGAKFVEELHLNTNANHHEFWVTDAAAQLIHTTRSFNVAQSFTLGA